MPESGIGQGEVDLIFTSPPFALTRQKDYGNEPPDRYVEWLETFVPSWQHMLAPHGSLVIDVGGSYLPGTPRRSTYHFELAVRLARHFELCQEFYWFNPAKLPGPAEWTNVKRVRVKDSVNLVLWFAKDAAKTLADNRRVPRRYSESMKALLRNGYQIRKRPSNHHISSKFLIDNQGSIPPSLLGFVDEGHSQDDLEGKPHVEQYANLLAVSNTSSTDLYLRRCREHAVKPHGARFPKALPAFFVEFLTRPGHCVCDPFAGSNTTGDAAESLGRKWIACELDAEGEFSGTYVRTSAYRFEHVTLSESFRDSAPGKTWLEEGKRVAPRSHRD